MNLIAETIGRIEPTPEVVKTSQAGDGGTERHFVNTTKWIRVFGAIFGLIASEAGSFVGNRLGMSEDLSNFCSLAAIYFFGTLFFSYVPGTVFLDMVVTFVFEILFIGLLFVLFLLGLLSTTNIVVDLFVWLGAAIVTVIISDKISSKIKKTEI
jgi:hypothetical protein